VRKDRHSQAEDRRTSWVRRGKNRGRKGMHWHSHPGDRWTSWISRGKNRDRKDRHSHPGDRGTSWVSRAKTEEGTEGTHKLETDGPAESVGKNRERKDTHKLETGGQQGQTQWKGGHALTS